MRTLTGLLRQLQSNGSGDDGIKGPPAEYIGDERSHSGKVRDLLVFKDEIEIFHSDRLSAFDSYIGLAPFKGVILCGLTCYWFRQLTELGVPNHFLRELDDRRIRVKRLKPVPIEIVVRGYLAGSMARAYEAGLREFCGVELPSGLKTYGKLPLPLITPTTKADAFEKDLPTSKEQLLAGGVITGADWQEIERISFQVFEWASVLLASKGWILVDTKFEFGWDMDGQIILMDEVLTPDSSRFWRQASYDARLAEGAAPEMFDKENIRNYLITKGFMGEGQVPHVPQSALCELSLTYARFAEQILPSPLTVP